MRAFKLKSPGVNDYVFQAYLNPLLNLATNPFTKDQSKNSLHNFPLLIAVKKSGKNFSIKLQEDSDDDLFKKNSSRIKPLLKKIENLSVSTREGSQSKVKPENNIKTYTVSKEEEKHGKSVAIKNADENISGELQSNEKAKRRIDKV